MNVVLPMSSEKKVLSKHIICPKGVEASKEMARDDFERMKQYKTIIEKVAKKHSSSPESPKQVSPSPILVVGGTMEMPLD